MNIIRHHLLPNCTALKLCNQRYEYVSVQKQVHIYICCGGQINIPVPANF